MTAYVPGGMMCSYDVPPELDADPVGYDCRSSFAIMYLDDDEHSPGWYIVCPKVVIDPCIGTNNNENESNSDVRISVGSDYYLVIHLPDDTAVESDDDCKYTWEISTSGGSSGSGTVVIPIGKVEDKGDFGPVVYQYHVGVVTLFRRESTYRVSSGPIGSPGWSVRMYGFNQPRTTGTVSIGWLMSLHDSDVDSSNDPRERYHPLGFMAVDKKGNIEADPKYEDVHVVAYNIGHWPNGDDLRGPEGDDGVCLDEHSHEITFDPEDCVPYFKFRFGDGEKSVGCDTFRDIIDKANNAVSEAEDEVGTCSCGEVDELESEVDELMERVEALQDMIDTECDMLDSLEARDA